MSENSTKGEHPKKLTKSDLLQAFKADLAAADTLRLEMKAKVDTWKNEYHGAKYGNEQKGKSELVSRDIKRQDEWQHASLKDAFVSGTDIIKCNPVTAEDREAAEQNQLVLNHQFTRKFNRYKFMTDAIKLHYSEGTVVVKCSWMYEDRKKMVQMPLYELDPITQEPVVYDYKEIEETVILKNRPDAEICRLEDIYLDPTSMGSLDKAQFIIHRYETDISSLRKSGKYKNLQRLALEIHKEAGNYQDYEKEDDTEFMFKDLARNKVIAYEYWGNYDVNNDGIAEPIVCTWVGDTIIQMESNPYPGEELPFLIVANNSIPFHLHGESNAELIGDNQKISTAIKRGILDNMANSNNAQKGVRRGALNERNMKRFLNGKNFEFNGSATDFYDGAYNAIPVSVFQVLEMIQNESESMLGVKSFSGGISGNTLGSTATSARGTLDAVSVRRLDIVRNLAENLIKPLMRKWMAYNAVFLEEESVVRITNEDFIPVRRDDLQGEVDIDIEVSTAEDNAAKSQEISFLLQTIGPNEDPGIRKLLMAQIMKLHKMPDVAQAIEEYEPQPDPFVEEMKQLEMDKLRAEIEERLSRARENAVDIRLKNANAALAEARAREIGSNADLKDQEYVAKETGQTHSEEMEKKDHDRGTVLEGKDMDNESKEYQQSLNLQKTGS